MQKSTTINNLSVSFDTKKEKYVLDNISFVVEKGEKVAILGRSGEGKTTLLKAIASLVDYDGKIENSGKVIYLSQKDALVPQLSAKENILLVNPNANYVDLLTKFGLGSAQNKQACALSGGMARRVAFARAFAVDSDVLLLDEPFTALDNPTKTEILSVVESLCENKTVLLVTHDLTLALKFCDRVVIIKDGKVALDTKTPSLEQINEIL